MKEIKILARAGQGAITTASLLGDATFESGKYAYAFPHFGAARMGAPMNAFVRVDDKPIRNRSQITLPDYLIVIDSTLLKDSEITKLVKSNGIAVVNKKENETVRKEQNGITVYYISGNEIAQEILGRPLGNTVLIGTFAHITKQFSIDALTNAINRRFEGKIAEKNVELAKRGYDYLK